MQAAKPVQGANPGEGRLVLAATPMGDIGDASARLRDALGTADVIAAEDTRRTKALAAALGVTITGRVVSFYDQVEVSRLPGLVTDIEEGRTVLLVTDAGMPSVSDPGAELVRRARASGVPITTAPGPSAVTTAVALSGLVDGAFLFLGFLPRKGRRRAELLERITKSDVPVLFFEAPSRMAETFGELAQLCPSREAVACRELTKRFEEVRRGTVAELAAAELEWLGELTVVVSPQSAEEAEASAADAAELQDERIEALLAEGHSVKDVVRELAHHGLSKRDLYARVLELSRGASSPDDEP